MLGRCPGTSARAALAPAGASDASAMCSAIVASMTEGEVPEADALEQRQRVVPDAALAPPSSLDEVPEADALEQSEPVDGEEGPLAPRTDFEIPEADALEQAEEVVGDEDY